MVDRRPDADPSSAASDDGAAPSLPDVEALTEAEARTLLGLVELLCARAQAGPCRPGELVAEIDRSLGDAAEVDGTLWRAGGVDVVMHGPDGTRRSLPPQPSTREVYHAGLSALDELALERHAAHFHDLGEDARLELVLRPSGDGAPAVQQLVDAVRLHLVQSSGSPWGTGQGVSHPLAATSREPEREGC